MAQIGQLSRFVPKGDIGQYFSKGMSTDVFCITQTDDGKWKYRFGFLYTALSSRIDTAPIYGTQGGGTVYPGYLVNKNFSIKCISGDLDRRIVYVHGFGLYLGLGLVMGVSHVNYAEEIKTIKIETGDIDTWIAGFKVNAMLEYRINDHFDVFFDASRNIVTSLDYTTIYTNNKFGIGINYFIKEREWDED